ncbi:hypothetical protein [Sphaerisporangium rufum]|nr:hypothetical protein [Sphaerisporangium rufum]
MTAGRIIFLMFGSILLFLGVGGGLTDDDPVDLQRAQIAVLGGIGLMVAAAACATAERRESTRPGPYPLPGPVQQPPYQGYPQQPGYGAPQPPHPQGQQAPGPYQR